MICRRAERPNFPFPFADIIDSFPGDDHGEKGIGVMPTTLLNQTTDIPLKDTPCVSSYSTVLDIMVL